MADIAGAGPDDPIGRNVRFNNADIMYGFHLNGTPTDLLVFSDRENDLLVFYAINPNADLVNITAENAIGTLLKEVTDPEQRNPGKAKIFKASAFDPEKFPASDVDEGDTAYGLCVYNSPVDDTWYVFVTRGGYSLVNQLRLEATDSGWVHWTLARELLLASKDYEVDDATGAISFEVGEQAEGLVADHQRGVVYIGQEEVAVYRVNAEPDDVEPGTTWKILTADYRIDEAKDYKDRVKDGEQVNLIQDIEGITLYYGKGCDGYLLISAQGVNSMAMYERNFKGSRYTIPQKDGNANQHVVNFTIEENGQTGATYVDGIQETDGFDVTNVPFGPLFPQGVLCSQDGQDYNAVSNDFSTNVKCIAWENFVKALHLRPANPYGYNPRNPN